MLQVRPKDTEANDLAANLREGANVRFPPIPAVNSLMSAFDSLRTLASAKEVCALGSSIGHPIINSLSLTLARLIHVATLPLAASRGIKMKRAPVTMIDPIDIALAGANDGGNLAQRLLAHQIDLSSAQVSELRIKRVLWSAAVVALSGLMILLAIAMVNASRSHALIVEPFHVPASLAARGLDGTTIANRLTDQFAVMRDQSDSSRAEDSYANGADSDVKIAIPNTGVSVGDVWRYLREWLGHDRKIGGDVTVNSDQVEITARISGGKGESFRAQLSDPAPAIDAAAASIFKQTQPYRYALLILATQGPEAALRLLREIAEQGSDVRERQWGYVGWATSLLKLGRYDESELRARQGVALDPAFGKSYSNLSDALSAEGRFEEMLAANRKVIELIQTPQQSQLSETGFAHMREGGEQAIDEVLRDDRAQLTVMQREGTLPEYNGNSRSARMNTLIALARLGEFKRAASSIPLLPFTDPAFSGASKGVAAEVAMEAGRKVKAVQLIELAIATVKPPKGKTLADVVPTGVARYAEMLVAAGRAGEAVKAIAATRDDCYPCMVARGEGAAAQRDFAGATRWFGGAARQGRSLPQADYQWGRMLAGNHDRAGALAHFAVAAHRAPGWYEPPYATGRLLMAQNHFTEARAALEKAHAAAPKRADVMLALGRAQWLGGDRAKAKATWAVARKLDLLEPEVAWLKVIDAAVKRAG